MIVHYDLSHLSYQSRQYVLGKAGEACFWASFGVSEERRTSLGRARLNNMSFYVCAQQVSLRGMQ